MSTRVMMTVLAIACVSMAEIRPGAGQGLSFGPAGGNVAQADFGPVKSVRQFTPMGEALPAATAAYSGIVIRQVVDKSGRASGRKVVVRRDNFKNGLERFMDMWK
jgi:hypothetical protein